MLQKKNYNGHERFFDMSIAFVVVTMINNTIFFFFKYAALAFASMTNVLNKIAGLYRKKIYSLRKLTCMISLSMLRCMHLLHIKK